MSRRKISVRSEKEIGKLVFDAGTWTDVSIASDFIIRSTLRFFNCAEVRAKGESKLTYAERVCWLRTRNSCVQASQLDIVSTHCMCGSFSQYAWHDIFSLRMCVYFVSAQTLRIHVRSAPVIYLQHLFGIVYFGDSLCLAASVESQQCKTGQTDIQMLKNSGTYSCHIHFRLFSKSLRFAQWQRRRADRTKIVNRSILVTKRTHERTKTLRMDVRIATECTIHTLAVEWMAENHQSSTTAKQNAIAEQIPLETEAKSQLKLLKREWSDNCWIWVIAAVSALV